MTRSIRRRDLFNDPLSRSSLVEYEVLSDTDDVSVQVGLSTPEVCLVVPVTAEDEFVLVRQFRYNIDREIYEFPAGKLEQNETPTECARRELCEETGNRTEKLTRLGTLYGSPEFTSERIHVFLAEQLVGGSPRPEPWEHITLAKLSLSQIFGIISSQTDVMDSKTLASLLLYLAEKRKI